LPKNEKRVIYSALRCSKPVWKTKEDDILKNVGNKTVDFIRWKSMATMNCLKPTFFKISSSFVFYTGLEQHEGE